MAAWSPATATSTFSAPSLLGGLGTVKSSRTSTRRAGRRPELVATLEPDNPLVLDSVKDAATRQHGEFQVTADGAFAAFTSALPLTGTGNFGFRSVFRYDAASGQLACSSCDTTGSSDDTLAGDAALAAERPQPPRGRHASSSPHGSPWSSTTPIGAPTSTSRPERRAELISSGTGSFDAGLLTVSADGTDVFFFTHDTLAPEEDENGYADEDLRRPCRRRLLQAAAGGSLQSLGRVPRARHRRSRRRRTSRAPANQPPATTLKCPKSKVKHRDQCVKKKPKKHAKKKHPSRQEETKKGGRHA